MMLRALGDGSDTEIDRPRCPNSSPVGVVLVWGGGVDVVRGVVQDAGPNRSGAVRFGEDVGEVLEEVGHERTLGTEVGEPVLGIEAGEP